MEAGNFILFRCHDNLAAELIWDAMLRAERHHPPNTLNGQAGLRRTWLVVQPAMQDSTVVSGLVPAGAVFFLKQN
jgi:hypothetical protein